MSHLNPIIMPEELKKKYSQKEGEIAFRLWSFALTIAELETSPNKEKTENLYDKAVAFSSSSWMEIKATKEERDDLQKMIDRLTFLTTR